MKRTVDILAPAGSWEMLQAAVFAGANSVYLGAAGFNARRTAENFEPDDLPRAVAFCHARNVKVNVAVNTVVSDAELPQLEQTIRAVAKSGADAVILQDLAAARLCREIAPGLARHASTQMSVTDLAGAKFLAENGFSRIILARELTRREIAHIAANCGAETEIFVHGAHCMCVSGQCYMSAFYGGRSGNRGACAGPCRLPYTAAGQTGPFLSLKDLSLIDNLPEIAALGVTCVKIEGRLRTPEYVAAAVDAARRSLLGETYDRQLLEQAFSRAGFTDGFFADHYLTRAMFGRRTEEDGERTKAALPALRELYRRERQCVPVSMQFSLTGAGAELSVTDGVHTVCRRAEFLPEPAKTEQKPGIQKNLSKCGGTPFYADSIRCELTEGLYCPAATVNELRRDALCELLCLRQQAAPVPAGESEPLPAPRAARPAALRLTARFAGVAQLSEEACALLEEFTLPLAEAAAVPKACREKTVLALPRAIFDDETVARALKSAAELGYNRFSAGSLCGAALLRQTLPAAQLSLDFGCNITNTLSALCYEELTVREMTLSPELTLAGAGRIGGSVPKAVLAYGHLPMMLVRACPMKNVTDCAACQGRGTLTDRKGETLPVECLGQDENGYREILNPIPLWLGDRKAEIGCETAVLYFTRENADRAAEMVRRFAAGQPYDGAFTRGLAYKGVF